LTCGYSDDVKDAAQEAQLEKLLETVVRAEDIHRIAMPKPESTAQADSKVEDDEAQQEHMFFSSKATVPETVVGSDGEADSTSADEASMAMDPMALPFGMRPAAHWYYISLEAD